MPNHKFLWRRDLQKYHSVVHVKILWSHVYLLVQLPPSLSRNLRATASAMQPYLPRLEECLGLLIGEWHAAEICLFY